VHNLIINDHGLITVNNNLSRILNLLLGEKKIKPTELARLTNLPQPTIQRIVSGTTTRPHLSSLEPIAQFFSLSIDQLIGLEPIPWLENKTQASMQIKQVPIIDWSEVLPWLDTQSNKYTSCRERAIISDINTSKKTFALTVKDSSMEPVFNIGTKIIIDPERELKDRCFLIIKFSDNNEAIFRQLVVDGNDYFVKPLSKELSDSKMRKITPRDSKICGILVQTRRDYE
jgi:SOS-response transcriptional repressor LexA